MGKTTVISSFSPEAPKRLAQLFRKAGSYHRLADQIGVNERYVFNALKHGIQPRNKNIARLLFFDLKSVRLGDKRQKHIRWWLNLSPQQRHQLIHFLFHYKENDIDVLER